MIIDYKMILNKKIAIENKYLAANIKISTKLSKQINLLSSWYINKLSNDKT